MIEVEGPGGVIVEFPDTMSRDEINAAMRTQFGGPKSSLGFVGDAVNRATKAVHGVGSNIIENIQGKQDPNYADVPAITNATDMDLQASGAVLEGNQKAKHVTFSDRAYADVLKKQLGENFIREETDENGYPLFVYRNKDGGESTAYVNKPGLDMQDVDRGVGAALPFVVGGGLAGGLAKVLNTGRAGMAALMGSGQAGASVAADTVAQNIGSTEGVDATRAALAGALGFAAPLVPMKAMAPVIGGGLGASAGENTDEQIAGGLVGALTGGLAARGVSRMSRTPEPDENAPHLTGATERMGLRREDRTPEFARSFAKAMNKTGDETESMVAAQAGQFNIPTTLGQRTNDAHQLMVEKLMRNTTTYGNQARQVMRGFDQEQDEAIRRAAFGSDFVEPGSARLSPYESGIGRMIQPRRDAVDPKQVGPADLGSSVREGLVKARDAGDEIVAEAFKGVDKVAAETGAFANLKGFITRRRDVELDIDDTPKAMRMAQDLQTYVDNAGTLTKEAPDIVGQGPIRSIRSMQKRLFNGYKDAEGSDRRAARQIYEGFNDWVDDTAGKGLVSGNPDDAIRLRTARHITKEVKQLFAPLAKGGKQTPTAKIIDQIIDDDLGADGVINSVLGASGPTSPPKAGAVRTVAQLKKILIGQDGKGSRLIDKVEGERVFDDLRLAYWSRIITNKEGETHTPRMMVKNIRSAFRNQKQMLGQLYAPHELSAMRSFSRAMNTVDAPDPNPSGSATGVASGIAETMKEGLKLNLKVKQQSETFAKRRFFRARMYQMLAKYAPDAIFGGKEHMGRGVANQATRRTLGKQRGRNRGGIEGALTAQGIVEPNQNK